jgi:ELWxxDGT repeat protein
MYRIIGALGVLAITLGCNGCGSSSSSAQIAVERDPMPDDVVLFEGLRILSAGRFPDGRYVFPADNSTVGTEMYITDGTPEGTELIVDLNPGSANGAGNQISPYLNGGFYFMGITPETGRELWFTDGTPEGTTLVRDASPGVADSVLDAIISEEDGLLILLVAQTETTVIGSEIIHITEDE